LEGSLSAFAWREGSLNLGKECGSHSAQGSESWQAMLVSQVVSIGALFNADKPKPSKSLINTVEQACWW